MLDNSRIIDFFDSLAERWDSVQEIDDSVMADILGNCGINKGMSVLDVASGTGILIPYYIENGVSDITAVDLSPKMIERLSGKFPEVNAICGDANICDFGREFDCIMIYNAIPHFEDAEALISHLSRFLKCGGVLSIAHGASVEVINGCHSCCPENVSNDLLPLDDMVKIMDKYFDISVKISDSRMYQVVGRKL